MQEADDILHKHITDEITDADYADDLELLANTLAEAALPRPISSRRHYLCLNTNKTEFICFKQEEAISNLSGRTLKVHIPQQ